MEYIRGFINRVRIKLNRNIMIKSIITALLYGAVVSMLFAGLSMVAPIYYAWVVIAALMMVALIVGIAMGIKHRVDDREAALYIDRFGFKEKIVTAIENEKYIDPICIAQREDAERQLRRDGHMVVVRHKISWIRLSMLLLTILLTVVLYMIPTPAKARARDIHEARIASEEAQEEVQEMIDALSKIDEGELSEEELREMNEMLESLSNSYDELAHVSSMESYSMARQKYDYKLGSISDKLDMLAQGKSGNADKQIKSAKELADNQKSSQGSSTASNDKGDSGSEGEGQGTGGEEGSGQKGDNGEDSGQGGATGEDSDQGGNQSGESGNGQGNEGEGSEGQSADNNSGTAEGGNGGSGNGSGQGSSSSEKDIKHNHDYVSVNENITGSYEDNDTSAYAHEQNGLAWEGTQVPYDTVINDYSDAAFDAVDKGKYPGAMSDVIKNYFTGLSD